MNKVEFKKCVAQEKELLDKEFELIEEIVKIRNMENISQKGLGELTDLKQSMIARLEGKKNSPQINTVLKILKPLGYTLAIVKMEDKN